MFKEKAVLTGSGISPQKPLCIWYKPERTCTSCTEPQYQQVRPPKPALNLHLNLHLVKSSGFRQKGGGLWAKSSGLELFHGVEYLSHSLGQTSQAVGTRF
jgi:hypothetical protein